MRKKTEAITVHLAAQEKTILGVSAELRRMSMSQYVHHLIELDVRKKLNELKLYRNALDLLENDENADNGENWGNDEE